MKRAKAPHRSPAGKEPVNEGGRFPERKRAHDALRENEDRFREQYQSNPLAIFTWQHRDGEFILVDYNKAAEVLMSGRIHDFGKRSPETNAQHEEILSGVMDCFTEHKVITREQVSEHFLPGRIIHSTAVFVSPDLIMVYIEDITGRKQADEVLRQKTALLEAQLLSSSDGILIVDSNRKKILQNQQTVDLWKLPRHIADDRDDAQQVRHFMHMTRDPEAFLRKISHLYDHPFETSHDTVELTDGTTIERYSAPVLGRDGKNYGRIWRFRDITERRKAEEALQESEEKFRLVVESAPDAIFIQTDGMFAYVNPAACLLFGIPAADQLAGTPVLDRFHPDSRETAGERLRVLNEDRQPVARAGDKILRSDGLPVDVEVYGVPVVYSGKNGALVFVIDITERRKAESVRESLISELAEKNTELDRFTYTASHDLKSPLLAIRAFIPILEKDIKSGDTTRITSDIMRISESAEKLENLINTLMKLSRSGRTVSTPLAVPFAEVVRAAVRLLEAMIQEHGVALAVRDNFPVVMGDRERLLQVMINLLDNAVKFMGDRDLPRIEVGVQQEAGRYVFFVQDNGMGIKKENLSKVFMLYERFNPDIPGSGIGLATVKRIVEAHGGKIWVESEGEGRGTVVRFTLPVVRDAGTDTNNNG